MDAKENENDYDIQSPLIDNDLKNAENYLNFIDNKINAIIKESNFEKSNIENESLSGKSVSGKMSFFDDSKTIVKSINEKKEKNSSFKESSFESEKNLSKKNENEENKLKEENNNNSESEDGYDNESIDKNLIGNLNHDKIDDNKKNRVPEGIEIIKFEEKNVKNDLLMISPDLGSIDNYSKGKSLIIDEDVDQMEVNMDDMELDKSGISKKSKTGNITNDKNDENGENVEIEAKNNEIILEEENAQIIKDDNENEKNDNELDN